MKKLGNYVAFGKISGIKSMSKMSPRGRKATKEDLLFGIPPIAIGAGLAALLWWKSRKKSLPYDPTKDNVVVSK